MRRITSWWKQPPIWKIWHEIGSFPQVGMKIKQIWNHHLDNVDNEKEDDEKDVENLL